MSKRDPAETLLDQNEALRDYLDALLSEVPAADAPELASKPASEPGSGPAPEPRSRPVRAVPDAPSAPPSTRQAPVDPGAAPEMPAEATPAPTQPAAPPAPEAAAPAPGARAGSGAGKAETGRGAPEWAVPDFQALLFHVGRMNLAVPLVKLHSVVPWDEGITAMPNQPEWCHGVFRYRGRNVTVIDTAALVLPGQGGGEVASAGEEKAHILIVGDGRWGLVCHTVGEVMRLTPDEVKWRRAGGQRPWLAGTVLGRLCALMDTEAFADMLARGWTTRGKGG